MNIGNLWADLMTLFISLLSRDMYLIPVLSCCLISFIYFLFGSLVTNRRIT